MSALKKLALATVLAVPLCSSGCLGPNNAFDSLNHWNRNLSDSKWVNELVFLGLTIIPVYSLFYAGDILIFNSIEFWGGKNPIDPPPADAE